ncbi:MAG TPA: OFA family MFS transporter [Gemmataceae bacterium]|nr:OFA family MFS transporter [Gemmataceae bacterium]
MTSPGQHVPRRAWVVTFAGTAVNLCLGILYAWSVWKNKLIAPASRPDLVGTAMNGINEGWHYLSDAQGTWAYSICGFVFALFMIPGGRLQDKYGPKIGATTGGLFLAAGCIFAGLMKSYLSLILGFGVIGGIGMGLAYAATTPAAVKWFGPHQRGLIVGLVVGGYGGAAIYISPLADALINTYGISGSFIGMGLFFAVVVIIAGQLLSWPEPGYLPPAPPIAPNQNAATPTRTRMTGVDWPVSAMLRSFQFYALVFLFFGSAQSGLLVIANATPILNQTAKTIAFLAANAWILSSYGGLINATGRIGTGIYSDKIGRINAYRINSLISAVFLFLMPTIMQSGSVPLLFLGVGIAYWQYGGGLALLPALTADFFGSKNLGMNYGLVFLGWGSAFIVAQLAGYIKDLTGSLDDAFYLSGGLLVLAVMITFRLRRPLAPGEGM